MHLVEMVKKFLLWCSWDNVRVLKLLKEAARRKQCNSSHVQIRRVSTSCPGQTPWRPFPQSAYKRSWCQFWKKTGNVLIFHGYSYSSILLVSDVTGVMEPHQLTGTMTPPRGQLESNVEAVFSLWGWVPPAEPIPLKLGRFLLTNDTVYRLCGWYDWLPLAGLDNWSSQCNRVLCHMTSI